MIFAAKSRDTEMASQNGQASHLPSHAPDRSRPTKSFQVLQEIFEAQVEERPDAVAVAFGLETATYLDLELSANRLARYLRARGVGRRSLVAILLPRSTHSYVAMLAALKSGAAYVPVDPEYPQERVAFILRDSGAEALVTAGALAERHSDFGGVVIRVDADQASIAAESPLRLRREEIGLRPRDLCYVMYTSGSTGPPKGVMVEHRSACHLVCAEARIFGIRPEDRVYQGFSLSFDGSIEEIWLAFRACATLVAATPEMARAGTELPGLLAESGVTVLSCLPALLSAMEEDVPTVRLLVLGGEACRPELVARWAKPGRRVVNTYGPTEATVIATYAELSPDRPVTIGRVLPGYRVYLLDESLRPVPRGEVGEICIGGRGVARGYVGRPEEARARFVPDPLARPEKPRLRIFRTGDLARRDEEGNLRFVERADCQVRIRGHRVELTKIESAILEADGIRATACALQEGPRGGQRLVAYVVPKNGDPVNEEDLRSRLRRRLAAYMVPAVIETLSELPRLPSGKLDRASLPAPQPRGLGPATPALLPQGEDERKVEVI